MLSSYGAGHNLGNGCQVAQTSGLGPVGLEMTGDRYERWRDRLKHGQAARSPFKAHTGR